MAQRWKCLLCSFICILLCELLSHLNSVHRECDNYSQTCGLPGCESQTEYTSPNSFVKHVRSKHRELLFCSYDSVYGESSVATGDAAKAGGEEYYNHDESEEADSDTSDGIETAFLQSLLPASNSTVDNFDATSTELAEQDLVDERDEESLPFSHPADSGNDDIEEPIPTLEILNRYCQKVKEEAMVSTKTMQSIRQVTISLMKAESNQCKGKVYKVLEKYGVDPSNMPELEDAFTAGHWVHNSPELNDRDLMKSNCPELAPKEIVLGQRRQWKMLKNKKSSIVKVPEKFYYVSLLASIEAQLSNRLIFDMVAEPVPSQLENALLYDFINGSVISEHELFSCDPRSLKIILYYDDLEITNERTRRKHKLAMFYYQLANIYPEYRSKLKSIHLVALCEHKYLKKYGMDPILKPFINDLQVLGDDLGHHFKINGGTVCLRGALLAAVADTPASNLLGAFKESVGGAKRKCRHCMTDFEAMQVHFVEEEFDLRNAELHQYHLDQLEENPEMHTHYSKEYGVVKRTILLDAPYFNVTKQLPQDIMHIILEGALSRALYYVLRWYLDKGVFSLADLNQYVQNFRYGYSELKDKPVYITLDDMNNPSSNLGQTAVQLWLLSRVFPFFMEPFTDRFPEVWKVFQTILEITAICCSKKISVNILGYLKCIVRDHLQAFKDCFDANIVPKQHYLVHLASQILMFGPPVRTWAMRFEAKHQHFKHIPRVTKNFKNLPKTMSERHQSGVYADNLALSSDHDASDHPLFRGGFQFGGGKAQSRVIEGEESNQAVNCIRQFYPDFKIEQCGFYRASSITIHGTRYLKDSNSILLAEIRDGTPIFGSISNIWCYETYAFFALKLYETVDFSVDLGAYKIEEESLPGGLFVVEAQDLLMTTVMHIYNHGGAMFVCPREDPRALID